MINACLFVLALAPVVAAAQPVYKCVSPKGATSYQSIPCAEGETSSQRGHAASGTGRAQTTTVVPAGPGQRRVQVRYTTDSANAACDGARAKRTAALGAAGGAAGPELRRQLDQDVSNACT